jgi:electron transfer flavoprotein beta subunit
VNIGVILREAPDPVEGLIIEQGALVLEEASLMLNELDEHALEEAAELGSDSGLAVCVLVLEGTDPLVLHQALARGATRAVSVAGGQPNASSRQLAPIFAQAVKELELGLVLIGMQDPGDLLGPLGPFLAAELGWPHVGGVVGVDLEADKTRLGVLAEFGGGRRIRYSVKAPAVLGIQSARRPPMYISGGRLRKAAQSAVIETFSADSAGSSPSVTSLELRHKPSSVRARFLDGTIESQVAQLVSILSADD